MENKETKEGYIYILTNPSFSAYVKIGYADDVKKRVRELNRTECTPFGFRLYAYYKVNSRLKDKDLHALIDMLNPGLRSVDTIDGTSRKREFFAIPPEKAYSILKRVASINGLEKNLVLEPKSRTDEKDEKEAAEIEVKHERAKPFDFRKARIPAGSTIVYLADESETATVCDDLKHVTYRGKRYSLSALADELRGKSPSAGPQYFMYEGKELNRIRDEIGF